MPDTAPLNDSASGRLVPAAAAALLVVDVQERLVPALVDAGRLLRSVALLVEAAHRLGVPTVVTEHCPQQIGHTVPDLDRLLGHAVKVEKTHFSAVHEPGFAPVMQAWRRRTVFLCGAEAHVCVAQTALGLADAGHRVAVVADAVGARHRDDTAIAIQRLVQAGIVPCSVEMVITEWLRDAASPEFKPLLQAIKARHAQR